MFWEMLIPAYFLLWLFGEGEQPGRRSSSCCSRWRVRP
jgi:hypothetical protein